MRSLNVTAMTVSLDPKITNAGASVSVTGHGIASSAVIPDSRRLDRPERTLRLTAHDGSGPELRRGGPVL